MTSAKTERLMKLLILLLVQRTYVAKHYIRSIIYPEATDDGFERMFDRDKEELRSIGVPVEVGQIDAYFDDEPGYRIRPDEFALPEIELTADEAAVVGLAARVWQHQPLARATTEAVRKLTAAGIDIDVAALDIAQPRLVADEPSFDVFFDALTERSAVEFDYGRSGEATPSRRHLQPWGVTRYSGRWYVVGFDVDRQAERVFRLSRVQGEARKVGAAGAYDVPPDIDISATARRLAPAPTVERAVVLARTGTALPLRRTADTVETGVPGPDRASTWDRLVINRAVVGLEDEVLSYGADVVVVEPSDLRGQIAQRLRDAVAGMSA